MITFGTFTTIKTNYLKTINDGTLSCLQRRSIDITAFNYKLTNDNIMNVCLLDYISEVNPAKRNKDPLIIPAWTNEVDLSIFLSKLKDLS